MYQDHFGLYTAPFALVPHLRFLYKSTAFEETMAHLVYGLEGGEDIILISGEIGSGKTLALHNLVTHVSSTYESIVVNVTQIGFNELLKLSLAELDVAYPANADRADLLTALNARLAALRKEGRRLLLVIDEAQNLSAEVLEGVRLLTNLGPADVQMIQIVLCGQPGLRQMVDRPELVQLRQRIRVHYHLHTLSLKETREYIAHRLEVAGSERQLFRDDAVERIHDLSGGVPRLVNILADRGLLDAYVNGADLVAAHNISDEEIVRSPLAEVQSAATASAASETLPPKEDHDPDPAPAPEPESAAEPDRDPDVIRAFDDDDEVDDDEPVKRRRWPVPAIVASVIVIAALGLWRSGWLTGGDGAPAAATADEPVATVEAVVEGGSPTGPDPVVTPADTIAPADSSAVAVPVPAASDSAVADPVASLGEVGDDETTPAAAPTGLVAVDDLEGTFIHVGSFRDMERAAGLADACREGGFEAAICSVTIADVTWLRVYVGPYAENGEAVDANTRLLNESLTTWTMIVRFP